MLAMLTHRGHEEGSKHDQKVEELLPVRSGSGGMWIVVVSSGSMSAGGSVGVVSTRQGIFGFVDEVRHDWNSGCSKRWMCDSDLS